MFPPTENQHVMALLGWLAKLWSRLVPEQAPVPVPIPIPVHNRRRR